MKILNQQLLKVPASLIAKWPEFFNNVKNPLMPLKYLNTVILEVHNGDKWNISFKHCELTSIGELAYHVSNIMTQNKLIICNVELTFLIDELESDILNFTKTLG